MTHATTIEIQLNGEPAAVPSNLTLQDLLEHRGVEGRMVAIEYNGEILPRHEWNTTTVRHGDVLEVVQMVGGG